MQLLLDGEVDDGGVLLRKEGIVGESLDLHNEVLGQFRYLKLLHKQVLMCLVLLRRAMGVEV